MTKRPKESQDELDEERKKLEVLLGLLSRVLLTDEGASELVDWVDAASLDEIHRLISALAIFKQAMGTIGSFVKRIHDKQCGTGKMLQDIFGLSDDEMGQGKTYSDLRKSFEEFVKKDDRRDD